MTTKPYLDGTHPDAQRQRIAALEAQVAALAGACGRLSARLEALEAKHTYVDARAVFQPPQTVFGRATVSQMRREHEDDLRGHARFGR